jgi:hypothetical protein
LETILHNYFKRKQNKSLLTQSSDIYDGLLIGCLELYRDCHRSKLIIHIHIQYLLTFTSLDSIELLFSIRSNFEHCFVFFLSSSNVSGSDEAIFVCNLYHDKVGKYQHIPVKSWFTDDGQIVCKIWIRKKKKFKALRQKPNECSCYDMYGTIS